MTAPFDGHLDGLHLAPPEDRLASKSPAPDGLLRPRHGAEQCPATGRVTKVQVVQSGGSCYLPEMLTNCTGNGPSQGTGRNLERSMP